MEKQPPMIMPTFFQHLSWAPVRLIMIIFTKIEIKGIENTNFGGGNMILAANHTNHFDPILLSACFPFFSRHIPFIFGSREKEFYASTIWGKIAYGGIFFRMMGAYPMIGGLKDYAASLKKHVEFIKKGKSICMFPRGKEKIGSINKTKGGIGYLAYITGIPVVPVKITGLAEISFLSIWTGRHKVIITFGKPIYKEELFQNGINPSVTSELNPFLDAAEIIMHRLDQL